MSTPDSSFAEKDFYLDEFRGQSLLFALRAADLSSAVDREAAGEVFRTLLLNDIKVLFLIETSDTALERHSVKALCKQLSVKAKIPSSSPVVLSASASDDELLEQIWTV